MTKLINPFSRRSLLKGAVAGGVAWLGNSLFGSAPLMVFAQGERTPGDVLIVVFQRGGVDGLSLVVPYGEGGAYYDVRPSIPLRERDLHDLDGFFGLHPRLDGFKDIFDSGHLGVIHAAGSRAPRGRTSTRWSTWNVARRGKRRRLRAGWHATWRVRPGATPRRFGPWAWARWDGAERPARTRFGALTAVHRRLSPERTRGPAYGAATDALEPLPRRRRPAA